MWIKKIFTNIKKDYNRNEIQILCCKKCSLVQVNPRKDETSIQKYYKKDYQKKRKKPIKEIIANSISREEMRVQYLKGLSDLSKKNILDIGSSSGEFLRHIQLYTNEATGIEPDRNFAKLSELNYGLNIFPGSLEEYTAIKGNKKFDVITIFNVIEHVHSPINFLNATHELLHENGLLLLEFPEIFGLLKSVCFKKRFESIFSPHHLQYFSINTISKILNKSGFILAKKIRVRGKYMLVTAHLKKVSFERKKKINPFFLLIAMIYILKIKDYILNILNFNNYQNFPIKNEQK
ncbi:hypothetical protein LCGC14_0513470 [marine sediment metagenome]|uniref:Methyltransferase type 11 domain-containing protein n=1 Tax=marine sediment metagenome TaxID=412755 RepID=A0A0F9SJ49_9ZZZZ